MEGNGHDLILGSVPLSACSNWRKEGQRVRGSKFDAGTFRTRHKVC